MVDMDRQVVLVILEAKTRLANRDVNALTRRAVDAAMKAVTAGVRCNFMTTTLGQNNNNNKK
jgi:hypothetical protein